MSKTYRDLTPDEAVALVDSGAHIEVGWPGQNPDVKHMFWQSYDLEFDWCPELAKFLKYRVEVE